MTQAAPFHVGERTMQTLAGSREHMAAIGPRVIRDAMPDQHRAFFAQLPFVVVGGMDAQLQPWASVLAAPAGFAHSPDATQLRIDVLPQPGDPLAASLAPGAALGLLGIEPQTRRRNRMNGTVESVDGTGFTVAVQQSFGNCPKYIQTREPVWAAPHRAHAPAAQPMKELDLAAQRLIGRADTFFIATAHPAALAGGDDADASAHGVDVSHRGGRPGFVRVDGEGVLTAPDFLGNFFFNTLGNLVAHPRAGLLFIDFDTGDLLHVAVTTEILWDGPELEAFAGAHRLLRMKVTSAVRRPAALPLRWSDAKLSPHLAPTGRWSESPAAGAG